MITFFNQINKESVNGTHTYAASCQEYFELGNRSNGTFKIRPNIEFHAFEVECNFNERGGATIMKPKQWNEEGFIFPLAENRRCSEANCFTHNFEYSASDDQIQVRSLRFNMTYLYKCFILYDIIHIMYTIKAITNLSTTCSQKIKHVCTVNSLTGSAIQIKQPNPT